MDIFCRLPTKVFSEQGKYWPICVAFGQQYSGISVSMRFWESVSQTDVKLYEMGNGYIFLCFVFQWVYEISHFLLSIYYLCVCITWPSKWKSFSFVTSVTTLFVFASFLQYSGGYGFMAINLYVMIMTMLMMRICSDDVLRVWCIVISRLSPVEYSRWL